MIDGTLTTFVPPIIAAVLAYVLSQKRSKLQQIKIISGIQSDAILLVQKAEEQMRAELRKDIDLIRQENQSLKVKIEILEGQRMISDGLVRTLNEEIESLKNSNGHYKTLYEEHKQLIEENAKEIERLRALAGKVKKR